MNLQKEIESILKKTAVKIGINDLTVSFSNRPELCDYQSNSCFALSKNLHKNPYDIACEIVNNIPENRKYKFSAEKPGFINIKIKDSYLAKKANELLNDCNCGVEKHKKSLNVIFDYGGANVAKELHVGHLCSPMIGESMKRLYKLFGHKCISDAHLGDWGLQMGLTVLQLKEDGVLDYYFTKKGKEPDITLEMLNIAYPKASLRKKNDPEFKSRADQMTKDIQDKKEPYYGIYKKIRSLSIKTIEKLYKELNAEFDLWYGESSCDSYTNLVVDMFIKKGLAKESEGALVVDVARPGENILSNKCDADGKPYLLNPMPPAIIKKYNGGDLYATTDIATIYMRNKDYKNIDKIIYFTDNRQGMHFEQVFRCCKMVGISPTNQQLIHIGFGTMNGKDGKPFKTRDGGVVKLNEVINLLINKASEKLRANGLKPNRDLALKIGVAAMKFGSLSNFVSKDYIFDIDKFLSFEGKTGPYIQYTVARINSILSKVNVEKGNIKIYSEDERKILISILKLISSYQICYDENSLNMLCLSLYDLASAFSTFYNNHHIINEKNSIKKESYLALCILVKNCLIQGLNILAIDIPEKM